MIKPIESDLFFEIQNQLSQRGRAEVVCTSRMLSLLKLEKAYPEFKVSPCYNDDNMIIIINQSHPLQQ